MMISCPVSRREFLGGTFTVATALTAATEPLDFPIVDLHVHLDNSSIEQVLPLAGESATCGSESSSMPGPRGTSIR